MLEPGNKKMRLSTRATLPLKALGGLMLLGAALSSLLSISSGRTPMWQAIMGSAFTCGVGGLVVWVLGRLSRVWADASGIEARRLRQVLRVPFVDVIDVRSWHALSAGVVVLPLVRLVVRLPNGTMRSVSFIARFTLEGWVDCVHPDVIMLRTKTQPTVEQPAA